METSSTPKTVSPPKVFQALQTGFDQTARHLGLILFPVLLDLFLWLGPRLRLKGVFQSLFDNWIAYVNQVGAPDLQGFVALNQPGLQLIIDQYNLFSVLRTFPIGIPSLMAGRLQDQSPLGPTVVIDLSEILVFLLLLVALILAGLAVGAIFFALIARGYQSSKVASIGAILRQVLGTLSLTLVLFFILLVLLIPALIILTVVGVISLGLAQFVAMVFFFFSIWLLLPLVFSAHGIYYAGQNAVVSLLSSVRLVRGFMPGTGFFLVTSLIVNEGLNIIWNFAESQSWMTLIGIFGHGFVVTSLISASFAYYRSGVNWMNDAVMRSMKNATNAV